MTTHLDYVTGRFVLSEHLVPAGNQQFYHIYDGDFILGETLIPGLGKDLFLDASLDLNFAENLSLVDDVSGNNLVTFSRASTGTYVGSDGLIKTSPVNLLTYSSVDQPGWNVAGTSPTVVWNGFSDPNGTNEAAEITFAGAANSQIQQLVPTFTSGVTYTYSLYARVPSGTQDFLLFRFDGGDFSQQFTATASWQRFQWTFVGDGGGAPSVRVRCVSPVGGEVLLVWGAQLEEGSTATTYIPTTSTISGASRFDHDPVTGESLGLLIEESRTNLIKYSSDLSQSYWSKTRVTTTAVQESNPFNYTDVYRFRATGGLSHELRPNVNNFTANTTSTFSAFATADGTGADAGLIQLRIYNLGHTSAIVNFDLNTGTANAADGLSGTTVNGHTWTISDYGLEPYGNGWYRVWMTAQVSSTGNAGFVCIDNIDAGDVGGVYAYTASETGGFLVAGIQCEVGSFKTSVIPTTGTIVTRAADVAEITGTNFSSWYNQSEGTVFVEAQAVDAGTSQQLMHTYGSSTTNNRGMYFLNNSNRPSAYWVNAGTNQALLQSTTPIAGFEGQAFKYVAAYNTDDFVLGYDGDNLIFDTAGTPDPTIYRAAIGSFGTTSAFLNGHISRLAYFSTRKSDQDLIRITDGTLAPAIITYGITSTGGTFNLRSTGTVDYAVDWDSTGGYEESTSNTLPHTYTAGDYDLVVYSDEAYRPYFNNVTADANQITSVVIGSGANLGTDLTNAWYGASNMTTFTCPFDVTSSVTSFSLTWYNCSSLTSFPLLNTSSGTSFSSAWRECTNLTSFPLLDTSSGTTFTSAWFGCNSLTSFPLLNTSSGTSFPNAWRGCIGLTSFPLIDTSSGADFGYTWRDCSNLTSFPLLDTSIGTNFNQAWLNCSSLTSFPLIDTSSGTNFGGAWQSCTNLTSFPLIDTSSVTSFNNAWRDCTNLTSFPLIDTSSGADFRGAWRDCTNLTSFPLLDTSSGTAFGQTWRNCTNLTSFPLLDVSSGTNFSFSWRDCSSLASFPANMFDTTGTLIATAFSSAWFGCALTAQSMENILVSLDTNGATGITLGISGGTNAGKSTWTAAANTAYNNLIAKGWTIYFNA
jgi:hypothetical protein